MRAEAATLPTADTTGGATASVFEEVIQRGFDGSSLLENFEVIAEADGGLTKLRQLILDLAIRGLLVEQTPGSAKVKVEDLARSSGYPLDDESTPFALPTGWAWSRLGAISSEVKYGYTASARAEREGVRLLRITDIQNDRVSWDDVPGCDIDAEKVSAFQLHDGDLVIARTGGTIGKTYLVEDLTVQAVFASYLIRVAPLSPIFPRYLKAYSGSGLYWRQLYAGAAGTGQPNVNATTLRSLFVPIPPLAEQKRLVAKVDQLMALCDELEARQTKTRETGGRLTKSALAALTTAETPEMFDLAWTRVSENIDVHIDVPAKTGELRRAIRDLAVSGRIGLVRNTVRWNTDGPFAIPAHWQWKPLGELVDRTDYGTSQKAHEEPKGVPVLRMNNIQDGKLDLRSLKYVPAKTENLDELTLRRGDLLFNRTNSYELVGKMAVFDREERFTFASYLIRVRPNAHLAVPEYINLYFGSGLCRRSQIEPHITRQTNQANFNGTKLKEILVPTPSIEEQTHIVLKATRLLSLCDTLHAKLRASDDLASRLAGALVAEAVVE